MMNWDNLAIVLAPSLLRAPIVIDNAQQMMLAVENNKLETRFVAVLFRSL